LRLLVYTKLVPRAVYIQKALIDSAINGVDRTEEATAARFDEIINPTREKEAVGKIG
jgi:hypothetical protein